MNAITMLDVIREGAAPASPPLGRTLPKVCPFCGTNPPLAARQFNGVYHKFIVGCEADECPANPQVSGETVEKAWENWNTRHG